MTKSVFLIVSLIAWFGVHGCGDAAGAIEDVSVARLVVLSPTVRFMPSKQKADGDKNHTFYTTCCTERSTLSYQLPLSVDGDS